VCAFGFPLILGRSVPVILGHSVPTVKRHCKNFSSSTAKEAPGVSRESRPAPTWPHHLQRRTVAARTSSVRLRSVGLSDGMRYGKAIVADEDPPERFLVHGRGDQHGRPVAEGREKTFGPKANQASQRIGFVVLEVVRLGPHHGLLVRRFDDQNRVARPVCDVPDADNVLAGEDRVRPADSPRRLLSTSRWQSIARGVGCAGPTTGLFGRHIIHNAAQRLRARHSSDFFAQER